MKAVSRGLKGIAVLAGGFMVATLLRQGPRPVEVLPASASTEFVLVLITATDCLPSRDPSLPAAIGAAATRVGDILPDSVGLRTIGVNLSSGLAEGLEFLTRFLEFDEVMLGGESRSDGFAKYTSSPFAGPLVTPQLLLLRRAYSDLDSGSIGRTEGLVLRARGVEQIQRASTLFPAAVGSWLKGGSGGLAPSVLGALGR